MLVVYRFRSVFNRIVVLVDNVDVDNVSCVRSIVDEYRLVAHLGPSCITVVDFTRTKTFLHRFCCRKKTFTTDLFDK